MCQTNGRVSEIFEFHWRVDKFVMTQRTHTVQEQFLRDVSADDLLMTTSTHRWMQRYLGIVHPLNNKRSMTKWKTFLLKKRESSISFSNVKFHHLHVNANPTLFHVNWIVFILGFEAQYQTHWKIYDQKYKSYGRS